MEQTGGPAELSDSGLSRDYGLISQRPEEKMLGREKGIRFIFVPGSEGEAGAWQKRGEKCWFVSCSLPSPTVKIPTYLPKHILYTYPLP